MKLETEGNLMRKLLWVVAVVALVLTVAAPAMALDFKFGAEYRVRFYSYSNFPNFDDGNTSYRGNPRGVQIRVRPRFDVSDDNGNIQATLRLEYGDTEFGGGGGANGSPMGANAQSTATGRISQAPSGSRVGNGAGGSIGADGVAIETKWAYIDFAMPWGVPLRVRAGIQPWYLPKGLIIDDDAAGVRAYGTVKPVSYEAFWYRVNRGPATTGVPASGTIGQPGFDNTRDNAQDYYGGRIDVAIAPFINPGAYFVYGDNRANCLPNAGAGDAQFTIGPCTTDRVRTQWFAGATITGTVGIVSYDLDFVYGNAEGGPTGSLVPNGSVNFTNTGATLSPVTVKGWAVDGGVHIPFGPLKFNILGAYATGDKQDGGDSEAFPLGPGPSWSGAGGQYELIGEGGAFDVVTLQQGITNTWMAGLTVEYVPVKALWIKAAYGYAGFARNSGNCANAIAGSTSCFGPVYTGKPTDSFSNLFGTSAKSGIGHEAHIRADYTIWTGFKVQGMAGWIFPTAGDTAAKYILQLYYNF
jgi:hypothetical protein